MEYRKKTHEVEAIQFTRESLEEVEKFAGDSLSELTIERHFDGSMAVKLHTPKGYHLVEENDYVIKDKKGNLSTQKPRIFEREYEKVGGLMDIDFISKKQQKERGYSVKDAFEDALETIEDTKDVVIITIDNDDFVSIYYSTGDTHKLIGHLEITKQVIISTL